MRVFVDSDVVISSLLSASGAASLLMSHPHCTPVISSVSASEIEDVAVRLDLNRQKVVSLLQTRCERVLLRETTASLQKTYGLYVTDPGDVHIVAGAVAADVRFLLSYNQKDFRAGKIKEAFDILLLTPGQYLQYLRSLT